VNNFPIFFFFQNISPTWKFQTILNESLKKKFQSHFKFSFRII
jgi:hypothetical protein